MRVLFVHSGNLFGGVETLMTTLASHQNLCPDMEIHFALCFEGRFSEELASIGATIYFLGNVRVRRPLTIHRARRNLKELLARKEFDLVVCHSAWGQAIFGPVIRSAGLPLIFWIHDIPDGMPWPERWARLTPPDFALCNSHYTADRLPKLYSNISSEVIYCPVAPPTANYSKTDLAGLRAELNTPEDATVILQISRLEPHKGHISHLEALGMLRELPNWVCWQVGSVQKPDEVRYFEEVKRAARRLQIEDRVHFLGWQPDIQKLIAASDIYCQPNIYPEPFGITFIEALYANKPVVATSIGGPKEIVDDTCGFLVSPDNTRSLADSLRLLIQNRPLRNTLGSAGPLRAQTLCDPSTQIQNLYRTFLSLNTNGLN